MEAVIVSVTPEDLSPRATSWKSLGSHCLPLKFHHFPIRYLDQEGNDAQVLERLLTWGHLLLSVSIGPELVEGK